MSSFGGQPYATCGEAFVVKIENVGDVSPDEPNKEEMLLKRIEAPMQSKHEIHDPMPSFRSAEQRLLELSDRKLHPFYKR